jgi:hypothetical protein
MTDRVPHLDLGEPGSVRVGWSREGRRCGQTALRASRSGCRPDRPPGARSMSVLPVFPTHGLPRAAPALRQETPTVTELDAQIVVL